MERQHLIGKLHFQIETVQRKTAELVSDRLSEMTQTVLPRLLERIFEQLAYPTHFHLRIDRIELNLGDLSIGNFDAVFVQKLESALFQFFQQLQPSAPLSPVVSTLETQRRKIELFEFYFQKGYLPWWAKPKELESIGFATIWGDILNQDKVLAWKILHKILAHPVSRQRFFYQFPPALRQASLSLFYRSTPFLALAEEESTETNFKHLTAVGQSPEEIAPNADIKQQLLFFLKMGRWPPQSELDADAVSALLVQLLHERPSFILQQLKELGKKTNLSWLLTPYFSKPVQVQVLSLLYPTRIKQIEQLLGLLLAKGKPIYPHALTETLLMDLALPYLFGQSEENFDASVFILVVQAALADYLNQPLERIQQETEISTITSDSKSLTKPDTSHAAPKEEEENRPNQALDPTAVIAVPEAFLEKQSIDPQWRPSQSDLSSLLLPDTQDSSSSGLDDIWPTADATQQLLFFLKTGRWHPQSRLNVEEVSSLLLQWMEEKPEEILGWLQQMAKQVDLAPLLAQFFSPAVTHRLLALWLPNNALTVEQVLAQLLEWGHSTYPQVFSAPLLTQFAFPHLLQQSDESFDLNIFFLVLQATLAEYLDLSLDQIQLETKIPLSGPLNWPSSTKGFAEPLPAEPGSMPIARSSSEQELLYFLSRGSLPENSPLKVAQLESVLLQLLDSQLLHVRALFLQLAQKNQFNFTALYSFSNASLVKSFELLFPNWWTTASTNSPVQELVLRFQMAIQAQARKTADSTSITSLAPVDPSKIAALPPPGYSGLDDINPVADATEQLLFFLKTGHWHPQSTVNADEVSSLLLRWLEENPVQVMDWLQQLAKQVDLAPLLTQFFAPAVTHRLLALWLPNNALIVERVLARVLEWGNSTYPHVFSAPLLLQFALPHLLQQSDESFDLNVFFLMLQVTLAEYLNFSLEQIQLETKIPLPGSTDLPSSNIGFTEPLPAEPTSVPIARSSIEQELLYFLEWSRFRGEIAWTFQELEAHFLHYLQSTPQAARENLLFLSRKINLAGRLIQQFSATVHREILRVFFPSQWVTLDALLEDLAAYPSLAQSTKVSPSFIWAMSLQHLLNPLPSSINFVKLLDYLLAQLAQKDPSTSTYKFALGPNEIKTFHSNTLEFFEILQGNLPDPDHERLRQEIPQWLPSDTAPIEQTASLFDQLQYRLFYGTIPWWDQSGLSLEALFGAITQLPVAALKPILTGLIPLQERWLPSLPEKTYTDLLTVFWGAYSDTATLVLQMLEDSRVLVYFSVAPQAILRLALLKRALLTNSVNSGVLLEWILQTTTQLSTYSRQEWIVFLLEQGKHSSYASHPHYQRVREVLHELSETSIEVTPILEIETSEMVNAVENPPLPYAALLRRDLLLILGFLQQGTIPAGIVVESADELEQIFQRLLDRHYDLLEPIVHSAFQRETNIERFLHCFSRNSWQKLARVLWARQYNEWQQLWIDILMRFGKSDQAKLNRHFFYYLLKQGTQSSSQPTDAQHFVLGLLQHLATEEGIPLLSLWNLLKSAAPGQGTSALEPLLPGLQQRINQFILDKASPKPAKNQDSGPLEETLAVSNAGLVIIAPYLPRYFTALGMVGEGAFVNEAAAARGVQLLQYLATQQTETPEHLLALNKILCGLPLQVPIEPNFLLTEAEKELSNTLLQSVLSNWGMMKNSTVQNLQGAFILRNGLLRETPDKWQLHVEKKPYDVVMSDLPWTISMVILPWMDKRMEVEWKINF